MWPQGAVAGGQPKLKSFSAFKRKFLPFSDRAAAAPSRRPSVDDAAQRSAASTAQPRTTGQSPGSDEHYANEAGACKSSADPLVHQQLLHAVAAYATMHS